MPNAMNQDVDAMRAFVRTQQFTPLTDDEIVRGRKGLREGAHSSAIEGNPFDATDWAIFDMFDEERAPSAVRTAALENSYAPHAVSDVLEHAA